MDAAVSSIVTQVVQSLMVPLKKHFGFFISSTKNVKDMEEKMKQLNLTEKGIRDKWEEAVARSHKVPRNVLLPWLKKVKEMNEKAQNIPSGRIGCFNMAKRYRVGKECFNVLEEIQALETRGSEIVFTDTQIPLAEVVSTSIGPSTSTPGGTTQNNFKSRDLVYKAALESLRSNNESQKMIALCGMGGVGKTTMMEQLKKDVEGSKPFDRVVKVVLGETINLIALQQDIAIYLDGKDLTEKDKDARAERLCIRFDEMSKQGKKTLVIMDDLWEAFDLKDVGLSLLPNGFKLLLTSRFVDACTQIGARKDSIFEVGFLNDMEANKLFFETVELPYGDDLSLQKIGEAIVKKCRGLPIAIVTMAKILRYKIPEAWKKALQRLEKHDLEDLERITQRIFEMSYENLKNDAEKAIFLLCGLYPDDFDIRTEDLLLFGWGLGFFKDANTLATARSDMKICVDNLLRANLLIKSDQLGCVKLHDLLRSFVLYKISEVKQASIVNLDNKSEQATNESYERILLKCTGLTKFPSKLIHPNLSLLMLMDGCKLLEFPEDIYERIEKLKVVSYENMHVPLSPGTSIHSTILRTLCLRSCSLINDDVSFLGSLSNLETLSLIDCKIRRLPSTIGNLKKLKLLDLTGCIDLHIDDGVFENLGSLEELYMRAYENSPIRFTKANCDELEILSHRLSALELEFFENQAQPANMSFKNLERFRISIGCQIELYENYALRNTIIFVGDRIELLECKINDLFDKTETLLLEVNDMSYINEDVSVHYAFSSLRVLNVYNCKDLTYLFTVDVASALNKLEQLTVYKCHVMRTLVAEKGGEGVIRFRKLSYMSLTDLPEMVSFWDNVIELPEMMELVVKGLPKFTSIYHDNHNTHEMQALLNKKVVIPKLRNIRVTKCDNLINLFPCNPLPSLSNLEEVEVKQCGSIEVLFNLNFESVCGEGGPISKLRSIVAKKLGKLKELWRIEGVNNSDIPITCFKGVESIKIEYCKMFKNVFTPTTIHFDLEALTHYINRSTDEEINGIVKGDISEMNPSATYPSSLLHTCHHLQCLYLQNDERVKEVVLEMDSHQPLLLLLPYLQALYLCDLKEMIHVWKFNWNKFLHQPLQLPFQNLTAIHLVECHKIKYLLSPLMAKYLSSLKGVNINCCGGIEEVISSKDDENTSSHQTTTLLFPHLEILWLNKLPSLKRIDDESQNDKVIGAYWSLCQYPTKMRIKACDALSFLIPRYAVAQMKKLQELDIRNCKRMVEVFESEWSSNKSTVDEGISGDATTLTTPTLTTLLHVPQLSNLKGVSIIDCNLLSHVFTFSTLESLKQLKQLTIQRCKTIQVIVKEANEKSSKDQVVFPRLEKLILQDLPNLKGFFLGMNVFRWPVLDDVIIDDCPQMIMFTHGPSKTPQLKYISTKLGKHIVECGLNFHGIMINEHQTLFGASSSSLDPTISKWMPCSFHNLVEIDINELTNDGNNVIPSNGLYLVKLEKIYTRFQSRRIQIWGHGNSVEEVFEVAALDGNESQAVVKFPIPNLRQMILRDEESLKYLWKSNRWKVLEFPNLTTVDITNCNSLEHIFTCSMVGSLVQLQDLHISYCFTIEVIVKEEEEYDVKVNEIMLPRLKSLKLERLKSLKGFCTGKDVFSFPALDTLEIKECPTITIFTKGHVFTPELKVIDTNFGMCYVKSDLNSIIKTKQEEGYKF